MYKHVQTPCAELKAPSRIPVAGIALLSNKLLAEVAVIYLVEYGVAMKPLADPYEQLFVPQDVDLSNLLCQSQSGRYAAM